MWGRERRQGRAEVGPLITAAQHPAAHTMATTSIVKKSIVSKNNEFGGFLTLKVSHTFIVLISLREFLLLVYLIISFYRDNINTLC